MVQEVTLQEWHYSAGYLLGLVAAFVCEKDLAYSSGFARLAFLPWMVAEDFPVDLVVCRGLVDAGLPVCFGPCGVL